MSDRIFFWERQHLLLTPYLMFPAQSVQNIRTLHGCDNSTHYITTVTFSSYYNKTQDNFNYLVATATSMIITVHTIIGIKRRNSYRKK